MPCRRRRLVLCMGVNKKEKRNKKRGRMERHRESKMEKMGREGTVWW